jgi:hypothetical protein
MPAINPSTPPRAPAGSRLMLSVIAAVGQAEREVMLERQREGIAKANHEGRYRGRVPTARGQAIEIARLKDAARRSGLRTCTSPLHRGRLYQLRSQSCFAMVPLCLDCGSNVLPNDWPMGGGDRPH